MQNILLTLPSSQGNGSRYLDWSQADIGSSGKVRNFSGWKGKAQECTTHYCCYCCRYHAIPVTIYKNVHPNLQVSYLGVMSVGIEYIRQSLQQEVPDVHAHLQIQGSHCNTL
jgi:hypothetical protein